MSDPCQRYAEDPEANAAHLRECAKCRGIYAPIESQAVRVDALPLAPWEGAGYRSWPLVFGGALALLAIALGLCAAAGISLAAAIRAGAGSDWRATLAMASNAVTRIYHSTTLLLLVVLLRRSPRGIDA